MKGGISAVFVNMTKYECVMCIDLIRFISICVCYHKADEVVQNHVFLIGDHVTTTNYTNPKNKNHCIKAFLNTSPPEHRKKGTISNSKKCP